MAPPNKKRKITVEAPEKIDFDFSAREEYLTGFHKRKVARQKHAQEEAAKREKEEKLRFRRELRQQRKADLEKHVEEVNRLVKQANGDISEPGASTDSVDDSGDDTFSGFEDPEPINQEDEYIDEDKYTTVTIESVGISRSGFAKPGEDDDDDDDEEEDKATKDDCEKESNANGGIKRDANGKRIWTKEKPKPTWPKKKKKKFRYESKADRKVARMKEGARKRKQKEARSKK